MQRPCIAVTTGEIVNKTEPWSPPVQGQSVTYLQAVMQAGGMPFMPTITSNTEVARRQYEMADAILLSGGNDPDPTLYGAEPHRSVTDVSQERDAFELLWVKWALADDKPLLGICRGMQLLNIALGGTLIQDIPTQRPGSLDHSSSTKKRTLVDTTHRLRLAGGSQLAHILGSQEIGTNTHHHQGIDTLGDGLVATAWADDGLTEALELPTARFVIGVQSHPESLVVQAELRWQRLFAAFVAAALEQSE